MNLPAIVVSALFALIAFSLSAEGSDDLEDLSFDDEELNLADGKGPEGGGGGQQHQQLPQTDEEKRLYLKRVMSLAMERPGAKSRLAQVLPILRQMSPPQRLALASLVMSQLLVDPKEPSPDLPQSADENSAQLLLPISMDIANMFKGLGRETQAATGRSSPSFLEPQAFHGELLRPPPQRRQAINRRNAAGYQQPPGRLGGMTTRRVVEKPLRKPIGLRQPSQPQTCSRVSNNVCVEANDYPEEAIVRTLVNDKNFERLKSFLTEPTPDLQEGPDLIRRKGGEESKTPEETGRLCQSKVELARPKKARATSGQWKYIVNTKEYSQTLRLEICSRPESRCTYLPEGVDSECIQVYNYHRLLTWDESAGLTMDVFKVPTCCSCRLTSHHGLPLPPPPTPPLASQELDSNLVPSDESPPIRSPSPSLSAHKNVRGYVPPKRESGRWPSIKHRGPPLPLEGEGGPSGGGGSLDQVRYPPLDNTLRRSTKNSTIDRTRFKVTANSRHPALPADSITDDSISPTIVSRPHPTSSNGSPPPPRRINYSYHPIIDYFRPEAGGQHQPPLLRAESRIGEDWTPISPSDVPSY